jgi:cytochrome c peroxidase
MFGKCHAGAIGVLCTLAMTACGGGGAEGSQPPPAPGLSVKAQAGRALFFDASLSASGRQSCATCHVPARAFSADPATDQGLPVPLGGRNMDLPGFRNAPALTYAALTPAFVVEEGTPSGGFFRDGRASSLEVQAQQPFITAFEMANADAAEVRARLLASPATLQLFEAAFAEAPLTDAAATLTAIGEAIAAFEKEAPQFAPFSSKYDAWLAGSAMLSEAELRGLALFNNPGKGNCSACHPSQIQKYSAHALFTDFTYDNIGVPRNPAIPANADRAYFDLGLCGPFRTDLAQRADLCGAFKVPTLRNVAISAPYFHNGRFRTLKEVVGFYVRRDTNPDEWYPLNADGSVNKYDDLPPQYHRNVNATEAPYNRRLGEAPALTPDEIDLIVEFLNTLTDGYQP